jgi:hypothetical protein
MLEHVHRIVTLSFVEYVTILYGYGSADNVIILMYSKVGNFTLEKDISLKIKKMEVTTAVD